jgi:hypothetical protein
MIKTNWMLTLGIAALSILFAPGASAGCGKALVSRLSVLMPGAQMQDSPMALAVNAEDATAPPGAIVGLWQTNVLVSGQTIFQGFESFTGDGLEFLNDNGSTIEGNVCFGAWTIAPKNTIKVYHPSWNYDASGNLIGTVIIKSQITLDPDGNSFKGTVVVDTYDLNGHVSAPELQAQLTGKRITAN